MLNDFLSFQKEFLPSFLWSTLNTLYYSDFRLKNRREMFFGYWNSSNKTYWKKCYLDHFLFLVFVYVIDAKISCKMTRIMETSDKSKDFFSINLIFKLLVWVPKIAKTYIISDVMGKCMSLIWLKTSNCKTSHWKMFKFFQTISDRNYGKSCYLDNFVFLPSSPILTMLRNNEQNLREAMFFNIV